MIETAYRRCDETEAEPRGWSPLALLRQAAAGLAPALGFVTAPPLAAGVAEPPLGDPS